MEKLLTTKDLMERWQCTETTVRKQISRGLKVIRLGTKDFRYSFEDIKEFETQLKEVKKPIEKIIRIKTNKKCEVI